MSRARLAMVCCLMFLNSLTGETLQAREPVEEEPAITYVVLRETEYYRDGPQQGRPADGKLPAGTKVRLIERAGSYVRIQTGPDQVVFISAASLKLDPDLVKKVTTLAEGGNAFALDLYAHLREQEGNLFFSPGSISMALAMTYAGAAGTTRDEMAQVLHFSASGEGIHEAMRLQRLLWESRQEKSGLRLNVANKLWGQQNYRFLPEYLKLTRDMYGAELALLNFADTQQASEVINQWVEMQTERKITNLIPPSALNANTRLVLTNAVYFHGQWADPFKKERTRDEDFFLAANRAISVPLMNRQAAYRFAAIDGLKLLELPYAGGDFSMIVLLPDEIEGLPKLESQLNSEALQRWTSALRKRGDVRVTLPRFRTTREFQLNNALAGLGMSTAFNPDLADFSGMNGNRELFISAVLHKAFVDVNEEGTEAAAATGVVVGVRSAPADEPPVFRADHPFLFLIRDTRSGVILFLGRVVNPLE